MGSASSKACADPEWFEKIPKPLPKDIVRVDCHSDPKLVASVKEVVARSFAGTTTTGPEAIMSWTFDPAASGSDPCAPLLEPPSEGRLKYFRGLCNQMFRIAEAYGGCFALLGPDGQVVSATYCFPPSRKELHQPGCHNCCTVMGGTFTGDHCNFVRVVSKRLAITRRLLAVIQFMQKAHREKAYGLHWYVVAFATSVDHQGQGNGGRLLEFLASLGDATNTPMYLECRGEHKERFYSKQNFSLAGERGRIEAHSIFEGTASIEGVACMIRQPKAVPSALSM
jgi:hypothetical protein